MRVRLFPMLLVVVLVETTAGAETGWRTRVRTTILGALNGLARRVAPPAPAAVEPKPPAVDLVSKRLHYKRTQKSEVNARSKPGKPDTLYTTITETWSERRVKGKSGVHVVPGYDSGLIESRDLPNASRMAVWKRVTALQGYLDGSSQTIRSAALPVLAKILEAAGSTEEWAIHDGSPRMKSPHMHVSAISDWNNKSSLKYGLYEAPSGWPPIAEIEFDAKLQRLKVYDSRAEVTITETRTPDGRAAITRVTTRSRKLTKPSRAQRALDSAFREDESAEKPTP